jgi:hypothetical protein
MNVREMFHVKHWRVVAGALLLAATLASAAPAAAQAEEAAPPPAPPPGTVIFTDSETRAVAGSEVVREFSYTWPAEVAAAPALVRHFAADRAENLAEQQDDFREGLAYADAEGCFGCNRSLDLTWTVAAQTPRFLVLSASLYIYGGGAHGNTGFDALVWDRKANKAFEPQRMFSGKAALQTALGEPWCAALKAERAERLGEEASASMQEDGIFPCPPIADLQIYPASSDGQRFDRIELLAGPYVAGSYAEGVYEVTLPVTPAVLSAVKPRYRAAFTLGK